jgi:hypothetical protein
MAEKFKVRRETDEHGIETNEVTEKSFKSVYKGTGFKRVGETAEDSEESEANTGGEKQEHAAGSGKNAEGHGKQTKAKTKAKAGGDEEV